MKLYLWDCVETLKAYRPGMAFAHAETKEDAIALIVAESYMSKEGKASLKEELESTVPDIFEGMYGLCVDGSA